LLLFVAGQKATKHSTCALLKFSNLLYCFVVLLVGKYSVLPQEIQRNIDGCEHSLEFALSKKVNEVVKVGGSSTCVIFAITHLA